MRVRYFTSPLAGEVDTRSVAGEGEGITFAVLIGKVFPTPSPAAVAARPREGGVKTLLKFLQPEFEVRGVDVYG